MFVCVCVCVCVHVCTVGVCMSYEVVLVYYVCASVCVCVSCNGRYAFTYTQLENAMQPLITNRAVNMHICAYSSISVLYMHVCLCVYVCG